MEKELSLKEKIEEKLEYASKDWRKARADKNEEEEREYFAVKLTLSDALFCFRSTKSQFLLKMLSNWDNTMRCYNGDNFSKQYFDKLNQGLFEGYKLVFGEEEADKLMSDSGILKSLDGEKIKEALKEFAVKEQV